MGREVRRVPATWDHPRNAKGDYIPLHDGFTKCLESYKEDALQWALGNQRDWFTAGDERKYKPRGADSDGMPFEEWDGPMPVADDYMPDWPDAERTHLQMYEDTTEGTPISPVMPTPEALARWLADHGASAFGAMTATYKQWLGICRGGYAPGMVIAGGVMESGVAAFGDRNED
jgi:hypothetical protein